MTFFIYTFFYFESINFWFLKMLLESRFNLHLFQQQASKIGTEKSRYRWHRWPANLSLLFISFWGLDFFKLLHCSHLTCFLPLFTCLLIAHSPVFTTLHNKKPFLKLHLESTLFILFHPVILPIPEKSKIQTYFFSRIWRFYFFRDPFVLHRLISARRK